MTIQNNNLMTISIITFKMHLLAALAVMYWQNCMMNILNPFSGWICEETNLISRGDQIEVVPRHSGLSIIIGGKSVQCASCLLNQIKGKLHVGKSNKTTKMQVMSSPKSKVTWGIIFYFIWTRCV